MGKLGMVAVLAAAAALLLAACRRPDYYRTPRDVGDAQIVALSVRTEPPGASVRVNRIEKVWTTPCDIADFSIQRGNMSVEVALDGYEPLVTRVAYDGEQPATLQLKLRPRPGVARGEAAPPKPPPVEAPAKPAADEVQAAKPGPVKIETVAGGTRIKVVSTNAKIRIHAKTVVSDPEKPGEMFLPDVPPDKVTVELLDPKTDAVIGSVEFAPTAAPAGVAKPPVVVPKEPVVPEADRVGEVKLVSKTYGVFVKLDPGLSLQPGEEIIVFRDGKAVARTKILKITGADEKYPDGAAQVQKEGSIQKGDEVRRTKP